MFHLNQYKPLCPPSTPSEPDMQIQIHSSVVQKHRHWCSCLATKNSYPTLHSVSSYVGVACSNVFLIWLPSLSITMLPYLIDSTLTDSWNSRISTLRQPPKLTVNAKWLGLVVSCSSSRSLGEDGHYIGATHWASHPVSCAASESRKVLL